jgi:hypothetical protein
MSVEFADLYDKFIVTKVEDTNFATNYTPYELSKFLYGLLDTSISYFYDTIMYDGTSPFEDLTDSQYSDYSYDFTGTSDTRVLTPTPYAGSSFTVEVNDVEWEDYSYDSGTGEMTISNTPNGDNEIFVGAYYDGEFTQDLNRVEKDILLEGMTVQYIEKQMNKEKTLNQRIYGKDYDMYSQANHLNSLRETYNSKREKLEQRIIVYSYRQDEDDLSGLGGRE